MVWKITNPQIHLQRSVYSWLWEMDFEQTRLFKSLRTHGLENTNTWLLTSEVLLLSKELGASPIPECLQNRVRATLLWLPGSTKMSLLLPRAGKKIPLTLTCFSTSRPIPIRLVLPISFPCLHTATTWFQEELIVICTGMNSKILPKVQLSWTRSYSDILTNSWQIWPPIAHCATNCTKKVTSFSFIC